MIRCRRVPAVRRAAGVELTIAPAGWLCCGHLLFLTRLNSHLLLRLPGPGLKEDERLRSSWPFASSIASDPAFQF